MNIMKIMKQAQAMQKNVEKLQAEMAERIFEYTVGGGAVKVTVKGDLQITGIAIDPNLLKSGDAEMLQDLLVTGVNGAVQQAQEHVKQEMAKVTGGLNLPGMG